MRPNVSLAVSSRWTFVAALVTGVAAASCVGNIGGTDSSGAGGSGPKSTSDAIGPSPMRRLNRAEYNATVQGIFGIKGSPADDWPDDGITDGFDNDVSGQAATADLVEQIMRSGESVADEALTRLDKLLPCSADAKADASACAKTFIETYAHRAYRRPLTSEDRDRLTKIFAWGLARKDLPTGIRLVIMGMLQSPSFLYRPEFGGGDDGQLTDHEIATRLSFFLTSAGPDEKLLGAADAGALHTPAQIKAEAARLLASDAGRRGVDRFFTQWLPMERLANTTKGSDVYKNFDDATKASMLASTEAFVEHVVFDSPSGGLDELLTANYAFVDKATAPIYGLSGNYGSKFEKVTVTQPRAGVLTLPGVLAGLASSEESSPIQRGKFVYTSVLCQAIGAPPANLKNAGVPPPPNPHETTRKLFEEHTKNPQCSGCHSQIDPYGFALENYDAIGRFRKTDNGFPVDASATINLNGEKASVDGAVSLAKFLANEPLARTCFVDKWFTYAFGRGSGVSDDDTLADLDQALPASETPIKNLLIAITQTRAFSHRTKVVAEECSK